MDVSFADRFPTLAVDTVPEPCPNPELVLLNEPLARDLGLNPEQLRTPEGLAFLTGTAPLQASDAFRPVAQAYAGHQFGHFSGMLGDGRAVLLGALGTGDAAREVHLKGTGRTVFSRGGDGKAPLGPMLREYVIGEALHALGIPTTRALAVLRTGETVLRERPQPGAILVRTARSHLRVGTMQCAAMSTEQGLLENLVAAAGASSAHDLLRTTATRQAELIAQWMSVGFVHGVMNSDNMLLSGESIDFGPCAFIDEFSRAAVFSSIDQQGRYAYRNQPAIGQWNLARLAEALLPLIDSNPDSAVETATGVLHEYEQTYAQARARLFSAKLGEELTPEGVDELLERMERERVDFSGFFREQNPARPNPVSIPRTGHLQRALDAAEQRDLAPLQELLAAVTDPFTQRAEFAHLERPRPEDSPTPTTFCGT